MVFILMVALNTLASPWSLLLFLLFFYSLLSLCTHVNMLPTSCGLYSHPEMKPLLTHRTGVSQGCHVDKWSCCLRGLHRKLRTPAPERAAKALLMTWGSLVCVTRSQVDLEHWGFVFFCVSSFVFCPLLTIAISSLQPWLDFVRKVALI